MDFQAIKEAKWAAIEHEALQLIETADSQSWQVGYIYHNDFVIANPYGLHLVKWDNEYWVIKREWQKYADEQLFLDFVTQTGIEDFIDEVPTSVLYEYLQPRVQAFTLTPFAPQIITTAYSIEAAAYQTILNYLHNFQIALQTSEYPFLTDCDTHKFLLKSSNRGYNLICGWKAEIPANWRGLAEVIKYLKKITKEK